MNKELVYARFTSRQNVEDFIKEEIDGKIPYRYEFCGNRIITDKVDIKFIIIPVGADNQINFVKGLRCKVGFGFDKNAEDYLTRGKGFEYSGYLMDYILEKNGVV